MDKVVASAAQAVADIGQHRKDIVPISGAVTLDEAIARALKYNLDHRAKSLEMALASGQLEGKDFVAASRDFSELEPVAKLAEEVMATPHNAEEAQLAERARTRLSKRLGLPPAVRAAKLNEDHLDLRLPRAASVELAVAMHLAEPDAPVYYVENTLICGLFGLLCWEAIFAPLPGAFFHPFHTGPVDLHRADFHTRRSELFAAWQQAIGEPVDPQRVRWWQAAGSLRWGLGCAGMRDWFESGRDPSVERAMIARRVSENQIDLLRLLDSEDACA